MQSNELNQKAQSPIIPQAMINIFAQSIYAQLEELAMEANHSLDLFENQDYTELKTMLQANIQKMQHILNNVGVLGIIQ